jgi:hypothetical protein
MRIRMALAIWPVALALAMPAAATNFDCGPKPTVECVGAHLFAIAKTLPDESTGTRKRAIFAESELAPGSFIVAVEYLAFEDPDPTEWDSVYYLARAGRFDQAIATAKRADPPVVRLGGLLAVATNMVRQKAFDRAAQLLTEVEPQLGAFLHIDTDYYYPATAAESWAEMGRFDHVARVLATNHQHSISALLDLATKYPAHALALREQARTQAEQSKDPESLRLIAQDPARQKEAAARAAQHTQATLAGSAWEQVGILLGTAQHYVRLGQASRVKEIEARAIEIAESIPSNDWKPTQLRNAAFNTLALARSRRGEIRDAIEMTSRIRDEGDMRDAVSSVIRAAIDSGHGGAVMPAIDRLAILARANKNASLLAQAGSFAERAGQQEAARNLLAEARAAGWRTSGAKTDLSAEAEWRWRLDGNMEAALALIATVPEADQSAWYRDFAKNIVTTSPADALRAASRISDPMMQVEALSSVAMTLLAFRN